MLSKEKILMKWKGEMPYLKRRFKVKSIALFGSYVRGKQNKKSDIDILVEFKVAIGFFKFMELEFYLEEKLGTKVDLVTPDAIRPLLKPSIIRETIYA